MTVDLEELLSQGETQHIDAKAPMAFEGDSRIELTKDIVAMANTPDGGTIIIGVSEDRTRNGWLWEGVSPEQARTFEVTKIDDFVRGRVAPPVIVYPETVERDGKLFVVLQIPEFSNQPHVCTKDADTSTKKVAFRRGDILIRVAGAKSERAADEASIRALLNVALRRRADSMLSDIARLMKGIQAPVPGEDAFAAVATIAAADLRCERSSLISVSGRSRSSQSRRYNLVTRLSSFLGARLRMRQSH